MKSFALLLLTLGLAVSSGAAETRQLAVRPLATVEGHDGRTYRLEDLGNPLSGKSSEIEFVSTGPDGERIAWTVISTPLRHGVLGIEVESGRIHWLDTTADFGPHAHRTELSPHGNDAIYVFSGDRFRIYKYTISTRELKRLHLFPQGTGRSWIASRAVGPDGRIYVGTYPRTIAIGVDPKTDQAFALPPVTTEKDQKYLSAPAVDDDNIMYAPVGRQKPELFACNLATGEKQQLLTAAQIDQLAGENTYIPSVFLHQGKVYTTIGGRRYLCTPTGLKAAGPEIPWPDHVDRIRANGRFPDRKINDTEQAVRFSGAGLEISGGGKTRIIPAQFEPVEHEIYRFGSIRNNVLYGSGIFPAKAFGLDLETLTAVDYGRCSTGGVQSYDLLDTSNGLLISSYTGATLDLFNPDQAKAAGNPRNLAVLEKTDQQERLPRLTRLNDRYVYSGSTPIKGHLGGAVVKVDLEKETVTVFRNTLPDQSVSDLILCPDGKTLFGNGSILGGTGSTPKVKTPAIFLWDTATDQVIWTGQVFEEAIFYLESGRTADGKIISFGRNSANAKAKCYYYFIFDPENREILLKGEIPSAGFKRYLVSHPEPMGPEKLNYFAADGTLYAYDSARQEVRKLFSHSSLDLSQDIFIAPDGYLYYLNHNARIARVKLF